ncbi:hypothetical protein [Burkholderia anthina]|uniref:hypothetical protein n=1 Tax=Burkholderia anthina TaxID=179879 RepID=UPI00158CE1A2|nr:hypothetical protein [Burkholderia anthina]
MNVQPGDLAYIADSIETADRMVVVVECDAGEYTRLTGFQCWVCKSKTPVPAFDCETGEPTFGNEIICSDSQLRRIGGVPVTDLIEDGVSA